MTIDETTTEAKKTPTKRDAKALFDSFRVDAKPELSAAEAERQRRLADMSEAVSTVAEMFEGFAADASAPDLVAALKSLQAFSKKSAAAISNQADNALLGDEAPAKQTRAPRKPKEAAVEPEPTPGPTPEPVADEQPEPSADPELEAVLDAPMATAQEPSAPEESFEEYSKRQQAERQAKAAAEPVAEPVAESAPQQVRSGPGTRVAAKPVEMDGIEGEGF